MDTVTERTQYQSIATQYDTLETIPQAILEGQLVTAALNKTSLQGKTLLDLGGGTGLHARKAIAAGSARVDLVEISSEMVNVARTAFEATYHGDNNNNHHPDSDSTDGVVGKMRFFVADAARDLSTLGLDERGYDVVMVNWLLDYSSSDAELDAFWRNISRFTKPGGWFVGLRVANPWSASCSADAQYGIVYEDLREVDGGVAYRVSVKADPPFAFEGVSMHASYGGSVEMHQKYGFEDVSVVDMREMPVVVGDPGYWSVMVDDPFFCCVTARKRSVN